MAGPTPGQVLNGRYELRRRIGGGSMGEVWRGRDLVLGRTVAVKIVLPALLDAPTFRARFVAEARVMAMMDHPGIVGVFDYGYAEHDDPDTPGAAFLVMEFIEGESLDKVLARTGPLEPRFALKVLASLLDALAAVHRTGVVHRDVKPANVMLTATGVVLADFGIARSSESLGLTAADALMGTVPYLAPELFQSETPTPAADVYAVGVLGYELLSGRQPFQAANTAAVMYKHMHEPPPPLPGYVAAPAAEVLWRALEKDAAQRWSDGADMAAAVRRVLDGPVEVGEHADLAFRQGGNPSGYEDTLTEPGGPPRTRVGYGGSSFDPGRRHARASFEDGAGEPDTLADSGGRHSRAAAFGETAASDSGGRRGRALDETELPAPGPDATRVFEAESVGRHASSTSVLPSRREAARVSRTDAARRRNLVIAAVAAPTLLGLTVALVLNSSGSSPSQGGGPGPGVGQQVDLPTGSGSESDSLGDTPNASSSASGAYYPHSVGHSHSSGTVSTTGTGTGTSAQSVTGTRSSASGTPNNSLTGPSSDQASVTSASSTLTSSTSSSSAGTTSSSSTAPTSSTNATDSG
ncbi:MAG: serine/threonine-protein kinase [Catenulispora sp.]